MAGGIGLPSSEHRVLPNQLPTRVRNARSGRLLARRNGSTERKPHRTPT